MTDVLQCPYCNLRFTTRSELEQHKAIDHPREQEVEPAKREPEHAPVEPERAPVEPEQRVEPRARTPEKGGFLSRLFKRR
jgi:hypothetical protein